MLSRKNQQGLPWQFSGQDSTLPVQEAWIQSLVGELRSHSQKKTEKNEQSEQIIEELFKVLLSIFQICFVHIVGGGGGKNNLNVSGPVIHQFSLPSDRYSSWMGLVPATPPPRLGPYSVIYFWLDGVLFLSACQCRRCGFDPWVGKMLRRRKQQLTPVFLP